MQARDPRIRRYPCPWCERPNVWPDACSEAPDAPDKRCARMIEIHCSRGDHRRCAIGACTVSARWHEEVREAGVAAATEAGKIWAVVSTIANKVDVIGVENNLGRAKFVLRDGALRRAGRLSDAEGKGLVYVVRASDGGFL